MKRSELNNRIRVKYMKKIAKALEEAGEEVLQIATNSLAIPTLDSQRNEKWLKIVLSVPTGTRDGEPFDGYAEKEDFDFRRKKKKKKNG